MLKSNRVVDARRLNQKAATASAGDSDEHVGDVNLRPAPFDDRVRQRLLLSSSPLVSPASKPRESRMSFKFGDE